MNFTNKFGDSPATETMVANYEFRELVLGFLRIVDKIGRGWQVHAAAVSGQVELFQNTSSRKKFEKDLYLI